MSQQKKNQLWFWPDGTTCYLSTCSRSSRRIRALLCCGVSLLRVLTLRQTESPRARLEAWEPPSCTAGQTLQVSEHTNTPASMGDTDGWLQLSVSLCRGQVYLVGVWFGFICGGFSSSRTFSWKSRSLSNSNRLKAKKGRNDWWNHTNGFLLLILLPQGESVFSCWIIISSQTQREPQRAALFICIQIFPVNRRPKQKKSVSLGEQRLWKWIRLCFYL